MGDEGWECVGVVVPEPTTGQFLLPNVFSAFTTVELDGYDLGGRTSWKEAGEKHFFYCSLIFSIKWRKLMHNK